MRPNNNTESTRHAFVLNNTLLDVFLRRPLLCLLRPLITHTTHDTFVYREIYKTCLDSSLAILSYQDLFDPHLADLDITNSTIYWDIFHTFFQHDIFRSALSVCEHMRLSAPTSSSSSPANGPTKTIPRSYQIPNMTTLTRLVETTLDSFTRRVHKKGINIKDLILLTIILKFIRARGPLEQKEHLMLQGATNTLTACRQHLLSIATQHTLSSDISDFAQMVLTSHFIWTNCLRLYRYSRSIPQPYRKPQGNPYLLSSPRYRTS